MMKRLDSPGAARIALATTLTRAAVRSSRVTRTALTAALATAVLGAATTTSAAVQLTATPALIMGGTGMPTPTPAYLAGAVDDFITPALGGSYTPVATYTPEEGLGTLPGETMSILESAKAGIPYLLAEMAKYPGEPLVVFGYSQSGAIAIQVKKELAAYADAHPDAPVPDVTFVIIGTGARPNGSSQYRLGAKYDTSIIDERNRLDTPFKTIDIAMQYDIATDAPLYPLNLLADVNWLLGGLYVHNNYLPLQAPFDQYNTPVRPTLDGLQGVTTPGIDTTYYFIPTEHLPLFGPLRSLGVPEALIDIIEPVAKVMVEWGYDRTIPPWVPTTYRPGLPINPVTAIGDLLKAVGQGVTNAFKAIGLKPPTRSSSAPPATASASAIAAKTADTTAIGPAGPAKPVSTSTEPADSTPAIANTVTTAKAGGTTPEADPPTAETDSASTTRTAAQDISHSSTSLTSPTKPDATDEKPTRDTAQPTSHTVRAHTTRRKTSAIDATSATPRHKASRGSAATTPGDSTESSAASTEHSAHRSVADSTSHGSE